MKKLIALTLGVSLLFGATTQAGATSKMGISANTTKANYNLKLDKNVSLALKNDNEIEQGVLYQPQKLVNGKWKDLDWYNYAFLNPHEKDYENTTMNNFTSSGTYRFEIDIDKFDKEGYSISQGKFYTTTFTIKK
ncbi:structural protein [Priestia megaterium]|uniref:structural protein n=1 Tax=Priestia megaterium TaxID=1404 RepID=UPI000BFE78FE|nr:structural protein [Priestia megaterium]PGO60668.1 structural protein [Priestia megaterium]